MIEVDVISMTAFISPFRTDREVVRSLMQHGDFLEIYRQDNLDVWESHGEQGWYENARDGEIKNYTGIDSPYQVPRKSKLVVGTDSASREVYIAQVLKLPISRDVMV